jgi:putative endonuclease
MRDYYIYIIANKYNKVLYTGVTNNIARRAYEHRNYLVKGFSSKYKLTKLVYVEHTNDIHSAIAREKQTKALRSKKIKLIESMNLRWDDLVDVYQLFDKNVKYDILFVNNEIFDQRYMRSFKML